MTALAFVLAFTACGASAREKTIHATLLATNAGREAFVTFDERHQLAIVEGAPTEAEGYARLETYKARRDRIAADFEALYRTIAMAMVLEHDGKSLQNVLDAAKTLNDDLKTLTGKGL